MTLNNRPIDIPRGTGDEMGKIIIAGEIYIACNMGSFLPVGLEKTICSAIVASNNLSIFYLYLCIYLSVYIPTYLDVCLYCFSLYD